jgi:hypothetical protein
MKKTYSTLQAARKMGVGFRTLNRWLELGKIQPTAAIKMPNGRTLWTWTDVDIARGRRVKAVQKPGPKSKKGRR